MFQMVRPQYKRNVVGEKAGHAGKTQTLLRLRHERGNYICSFIQSVIISIFIPFVKTKSKNEKTTQQKTTTTTTTIKNG